jgi:hypothetical protein
MRRDVAGLIVLLLASNGAWAWHALARDEDEAERGDAGAGQEPPPAPQAEIVLQGTARSSKSATDAAPLEPRGDAPRKPTQEEEFEARIPEARRRAMADAQARLEAEEARVEQARAGVQAAVLDVLQIEDADRREQGLAALELALRDRHPDVATTALHALQRIREAKVDRTRFRAPVLERL